MDVTDGSSQFPIPACTGAQISTPRNAALPLTPLFPTVGLQLSGYYDQPSRIVGPMEKVESTHKSTTSVWFQA